TLAPARSTKTVDVPKSVGRNAKLRSSGETLTPASISPLAKRTLATRVPSRRTTSIVRGPLKTSALRETTPRLPRTPRRLRSRRTRNPFAAASLPAGVTKEQGVRALVELETVDAAVAVAPDDRAAWGDNLEPS